MPGYQEMVLDMVFTMDAFPDRYLTILFSIVTGNPFETIISPIEIRV